eukprot:TRINITY_DN3157_c0_g1_i2.p1 TRINITY_DN3157_c0_g1~~TRINITY_DN3157_c0_g1_i2.p1  ORF type:complete len:345 (-),score=41.66 TRINITY_DN3157_c0_g1_i2:657-1691(-)
MGEKHARFYARENDKFQFTAVCDTDKEKLTAAKKEYPECRVYTDAADFLAQLDLDLVVICTLSTDHTRHAMQALSSGKYVLLDKPIALTDHELAMLREMDQKYPNRLFILHNLRFEPGIAEVSNIIASGILGSIHMIKLRRHHELWGFFRSDWQTVISSGGGILGNWGNHDIDHAVQLLGSYPVNIWSRLWHLTAGGDGDDHAKILLTGADGRLVDIEVSYNVTLPEPYCSVYGCRGSMICHSPWSKEYRLKYLSPEVKMPELSVDWNPISYSNGISEVKWVEENRKISFSGDVVEYIDRELIRHLYKAIINGIPFPIKNADAFETVRIMQEIRKQNSQFNWPK